MNKDDLLKHIAETGYNVGFGAKKHFATYDIVEKTPGLISFFSMAFGIYALVFTGLSTKWLSAAFIVLGIIGLYVSFYDNEKHEYEKKGKELILLFNQLKMLYFKVKNDPNTPLTQYEAELKTIETDYYQNSISKQMLFSDWYAHYKFFWQHQIEWIKEQKKFRLFRDKIPLSLCGCVLLLLILAILNLTDLINQVCILVDNKSS